MVTKKTTAKKKVAKKPAVAKTEAGKKVVAKKKEVEKEPTKKKAVVKKPAAKKPAVAKTVADKKEEVVARLRIRVQAYEYKILDSSVKQIMDTALRLDAQIVGPVPLPTEIKKYTVNRSPFVFKDSREQFEIRVHKRLIDIINPTSKVIESLTNLSLPSGVGIDVKML